jgi:hypothetical protein
MAIVDVEFYRWFAEFKKANPQHFMPDRLDSAVTTAMTNVAQWAFTAGRRAGEATTPQPGASTQGLREGYYLASFKRSHDRGYVTWWMANDAGYTYDLNQAGIYTELTPGYHDSEYTVPVPVQFIDRLRVRRMVDAGDSANRSMWNAKDLRSALESLLTSPTTGADGGGS